MVRSTALWEHFYPLCSASSGRCSARATLALENAALRQQLTIYQTDSEASAAPNRRSRLLGRPPQALVRLGSRPDRRQARDRDRLAPSRLQAVLAPSVDVSRRSADPGFPASTSPSSAASPATTPSGARTRSPRSSPPSSGSTIPRARSAATWSGAPMAPARPRPGAPSFSNHAKEVWACDFLTQYTAFFAVVYVFVIMEVGSRRIVHVNVTTNPTLAWVKQQIREATAWDQTPRFLVHDNDGIFGQFGRPVTVERDGQNAQLPLPSRSLAARGHGDRGTADPVRSTERIAPRRAIHADAAGGGARPLHLPQRRSHPPRRHASTSATTTGRGHRRRSTGSRIRIRS